MKRTFIIVVAITLCLLTAGCGSIFGPPWYCVVRDWDMVASVTSESGYTTYYPDPGYAWLVLGVTITNNSAVNASINPFMEEFTWFAYGLGQFEWQLLWNSPEGGLTREFQPYQAKSGDLFFMVPATVSPTSGRLIWTQTLPQYMTRMGIDLTGVPRR